MKTAKQQAYEWTEYIKNCQETATVEIPDTLLEFIKEFQPNIGRKKRNMDLFPFWIEVLDDQHNNVMCVNGRQTHKSTNAGSDIAFHALKYPGDELSVVLDDEQHKSAFSEQRLRNDVFLSNSRLRGYLPQGRASIFRIKLKNSSVIYVLTDENKFHGVEGKSNRILIIDEAQAQELQYLGIATYSLSATKGKLKMYGVGGEAGSPYHARWKKSTMSEWIYDDPLWRDNLTFNSLGDINNTPEQLSTILKGKWVAQNPGADIHGYHFPQTIFPTIPLTIHDAVHKHRALPEISVEYQKKHNPESMYLSHTLGEFYKAERRPITPEMVERCYARDMTLLKPFEVRQLKEIYGNEIRILGGVDFGSGETSSSQTIVCIMIRWRKSGRYQIVWIEPRPKEHPADQSAYLASIFEEYNVEVAVGDWGYGQDQVRYIQDGGRDSSDKRFAGLGRKRFIGCRTHGDFTKPEMDISQNTDEKGVEFRSVRVDKTTIIQNFVNFVGQTVAHPLRPNDENLNRTLLVIPAFHDYETDFLMDDFCSITRKDIKEDVENNTEDPRQKAVKEYNHPPDSVMSIIYCLVADQNYKEGAYTISPISRRSTGHRRRLR